MISEWIPVEEKLPENGQEVLITLAYPQDTDGYARTTTGWHINGTWFIGRREPANTALRKVVAWTLLPEPYKGGSPDRI